MEEQLRDMFWGDMKQVLWLQIMSFFCFLLGLRAIMWAFYYTALVFLVLDTVKFGILYHWERIKSDNDED
jgi:hypothetical protein